MLDTEDMRIRRMNEDDIDRVLEVERDSFSTPWSRESFLREISENKLAEYVVVEVDGKIVGYGGMWLILGEAHITNIAVASDYRNRKLGSKILKFMVEICRELSIKEMTLEVRRSNKFAIRLYENNGFIRAGIRPNYYSKEEEDAIIMWKSL